jgi:TP901 family phage tail tape measure protein
MTEVLARFNKEVDSPAIRNAERNLAKFASGNEKIATSSRNVADQTQLYNKYLYDQGRALGNVTTQLEQYRRTQANVAKEMRAASAASVGNNLSYIPQNQPDNYRVGSAFGNIVDEDDRRAQQASRSYHNLSTAMDDVIDARQRESSTFAQSLRAQMEGDVANEKSVASQKNLSQSLSTTRYAMFSAAATMGILSAGLIAFNVATIGTAVSFERAFANVTRTSDAMRQSASLTADLRDQFVSMAQELPVAFEDLSAIGALGNQLGVQTDNLASFTKVVAEFSTVTGMSADESATAFGRLDALLPDVQHNFVALGSSILKAGVTSVATEAQIVKTSVQISAMGRQAGLTTGEIVGLAAGFASIGVPPELSRGTVVRLFSQMGKAVDQGGDKLQAFAAVSGVSAQQFASTYGKAGFGDIFLKFMAGIAQKGGDARATLEDLGIKSVRDIPALLNLANAADSTGKSFSETAGKAGLLTQVFDAGIGGFKEQTEIFDQYAIITDTVSAKLQILANNFQVFLAAIGESTVGPFSFLIDGFTQVLKLMTDMASNPWGQALLAGIGVVTALAGVVTGLGAVLALAASGVIGLQQAMIGLNRAGIAVGLTGFITQLGEAGIATRGLTTAINIAKVAMAGLALGAVTAGVALLSNAIVDAERNWLGFGGGAEEAMKRIKGTINKYSFSNELSKVLNGSEVMAQFQRSFGVNNLQPVLRDLASVDEQMSKIVGEGGATKVAKELQGLQAAFHAAGDDGSQFKAYMTDTVHALEDAGYKVKFTKDGFMNLIPPTKEAAAAAGDMATAEAIAAQQTEDLATALNVASTDLGTMADGALWTADILKSFISDFASGSAGFVGYSDAMNTAQQRTAEAAAEAAGKGKDAWKDFVDTSSVNMGFFTEALTQQVQKQGVWINDMGILAGRGADAFVQGLAKMGPEGAALAHAAVGMTKDELDKLEEQARLSAFYASTAFSEGFTAGFPTMKEVYDQGGNLALAAFVAAQVDGSPEAMAAVIAKFNLDLSANPLVPPPIAPPVVPDVDTTPAATKLTAFVNTPRVTVPLKADADPGPAGQTLDLFLRTPRTTTPIKSDADPGPAGHTLDLFIRTPRATGPIKADADPGPAGRTLDLFLRTPRTVLFGTSVSTANAETQISNFISRSRTVTINLKTGTPSGLGPLKPGMATGGYVRGPGTGTSDSIDTRLSNGEYVIKASSVRKVGVGYLDALNGGHAKMHSGNGYAQGGAVKAPTGISIVELSPTDRALLRAAGNLQVVIPGTFIAQATNSQTVRDNNRGAF